MAVSIVSMVLAAARPWTYWLALPLLVAELVLIVGLAIEYYRKVLVPSYQRQLYEEQHRTGQLSNRGTAAVHRLRPPGDQLDQRRAA